ncbi:MAG: peptidyl-alpha-hydroxyglycine alpha-amidating lyase family protein [Janthinobacterium lividum]
MSLAGLGALVPVEAALAQSCVNTPAAYVATPFWGTLPDGRTWGATSGVFLDRKGHIWSAERCGANSCSTSSLDPVLEFDSSGQVLKAMGAGLFVQPHSLTVDRSGNIWVADDQGEAGKGQQVIKLSPKGKVLMRLGQAGLTGPGVDRFDQPTAIAVAPDGEIFVAEGHAPSNGNSRILRFAPDGRYLQTIGSKGSGPGQFLGPHALAFDSKGRLFVGDRGNSRIVVMTRNGKELASWKQFGSPGGVFIDRHDRLYVADSSSTPEENPGCPRGIRIGSAHSGDVSGFIPDTSPATRGTSGAEGVAVDAAGTIYGAEVGARDLKRYVPNRP